MNLGENIKKVRELKNFTQQYLADELGLSLSGYGKIERDQTELTLSRLIRICKILEVDLFILINFNGKDLIKDLNQQNGNGYRSPESLKISEDFHQQLIQKYKEENNYLKELVKNLLERNVQNEKN